MKKYLVSLIVLAVAFAYFSDFSINHWMSSKITGVVSAEKYQTSFKSYMTQVKGLKRLQVAELKQLEVLSQTSRRRILWDKLELPPVVVALEIPVIYTYSVDLDKDWSIQKVETGEVLVVAPALDPGEPAADVSAIKVRVEKSSLFRNEKNTTDRLIKQITSFLRQRAQDHKELVRENSRQQVKELVESWLSQEKDTATKVTVFFSGEVSAVGHK